MFLRFNLFTIIWGLVIFILILMPGQQMPQLGNLFSFDKIAHLGVFFLLTFLMIQGFEKQFTYGRLKKNSQKYGVALSALYASSLELSQALIPERSANFYDLGFNLAGVFLGYLFFLFVYKLTLV